jgi:hypothetical protein
VDRVGMRQFGGGDDVGDVEIGISGGRWTDADRLVGEPDVHRLGVGGRMDRDRLDPHFVAGAVDAQCYLAAIGDEDFREGHVPNPPLFDDEQGLVVFDRLRVLDHDA